jgi:hypothetical protein
LPKSSGRIQQVLVDTGARSRPAKAWPRAEDIAAGNAALAQHQTRLSKMRSGGRSEDILASEAGLTAAEAKLQALQNGADDGARQAQQCAVDSDAAAVATAEVAYAALRGQNSANLQAAQAQVDSLEAQIAIAQSLIKSFVQLKDRNLRTCTPDQLSEVVRGFGADIPGVKVTAAPISQFGPGGASVQVRVQGDLIGNALHAEAVHINGDPADDRRQRGQDIAEASVRKAAVRPHWR